MKRRNFLAALGTAVLVPWKQVLPAFSANHTLPYTVPQMTFLSPVGDMFRVGDLITITDGSGQCKSRVMKIFARDEINQGIYVVDEPDERTWPTEWENLARHM